MNKTEFKTAFASALDEDKFRLFTTSGAALQLLFLKDASGKDVCYCAQESGSTIMDPLRVYSYDDAKVSSPNIININTKSTYFDVDKNKTPSVDFNVLKTKIDAAKISTASASTGAYTYSSAPKKVNVGKILKVGIPVATVVIAAALTVCHFAGAADSDQDFYDRAFELGAGLVPNEMECFVYDDNGNVKGATPDFLAAVKDAENLPAQVESHGFYYGALRNMNGKFKEENVEALLRGYFEGLGKNAANEVISKNVEIQSLGEDNIVINNVFYPTENFENLNNSEATEDFIVSYMPGKTNEERAGFAVACVGAYETGFSGVATENLITDENGRTNLQAQASGNGASDALADSFHGQNIESYEFANGFLFVHTEKNDYVYEGISEADVAELNQANSWEAGRDAMHKMIDGKEPTEYTALDRTIGALAGKSGNITEKAGEDAVEIAVMWKPAGLKGKLNEYNVTYTAYLKDGTVWEFATVTIGVDPNASVSTEQVIRYATNENALSKGMKSRDVKMNEKPAKEEGKDGDNGGQELGDDKSGQQEQTASK